MTSTARRGWLPCPGRTIPTARRTIAVGMAPCDDGVLQYFPLRAALGIGCSRNCPPEELAELAERVLAEASIDPRALAGVFSVDLKADEPAVLDLAARLELPLRLFTADELETERDRLQNPSEAVFAEIGCHGVAEGAALAGAGSDAMLVLPKRKTAHATCALALSPEPITKVSGRKRGSVMLVSTGPGQADWRAPEASIWVHRADELVGYGPYIDLLGPIAAGKPRRDYPLGGEEDRCRYALERAGEGYDVALVCSGDAGIYAMGALVYELLARAEAEGRRVGSGAAGGGSLHAGHFGLPGGGGAGRRTHRSRFLRHFAVQPADPARDHSESHRGGGGRRLRRRLLQSGFQDSPGTA